MTGWKLAAVWVAGIYVVFLIGGNFSFRYTHDCVRSHKEYQVVNSDGDEELVTICDFYSANGKRWTLLDPARSIYSEWKPTGWGESIGLAALVGWFGLAFISAFISARRKEARERFWREYDAADGNDPDPSFRDV